MFTYILHVCVKVQSLIYTPLLAHRPTSTLRFLAHECFLRKSTETSFILNQYGFSGSDPLSHGLVCSLFMNDPQTDYKKWINPSPYNNTMTPYLTTTS